MFALKITHQRYYLAALDLVSLLFIYVGLGLAQSLYGVLPGLLGVFPGEFSLIRGLISNLQTERISIGNSVICSDI